MTTCAEIDPLVTSFVDGEMADEARAAVDAHLSACESCRARVAAERAARAVVRARREVLCGTAPTELKVRCARLAALDAPAESAFARPLARLAVRRWVPLSVAAGLLLAVLGTVLYGLSTRLEAAFAAQLAIDHIKCFELGDPGDVEVDPAVAAEAWRQRAGWSIAVPPGNDAMQLSLLEVRGCAYSGGRVAHVLYRCQGRPLSLYIVPNTMRHERILEILGHGALIWSRDRRSYVLVGPDSPAAMQHVAAYVRGVVR